MLQHESSGSWHALSGRRHGPRGVKHRSGFTAAFTTVGLEPCATGPEPGAGADGRGQVSELRDVYPQCILQTVASSQIHGYSFVSPTRLTLSSHGDNDNK